jgi:NAD(P)-dependent dehydrogenase (short-subunit alcohol dehydrogenase family)
LQGEAGAHTRTRSIGLGLAKAYLEQGYTVIGAVREPSKQPPLEGLITVKIDAESDTDPFEVGPGLALQSHPTVTPVAPHSRSWHSCDALQRASTQSPPPIPVLSPLICALLCRP